MARSDKSLYTEVGVTGLDFTYGAIRSDPEPKMFGKLGIDQYNLMRHTDPTVSAVLMALSLPVRDAAWRVNPASSAGPDVEAAEFVESCLHDMSFSWDDILTEICTMFAFGWAYMEWVLKPRLGPNPPKGFAPSQYSDGRIGFKKIALRGQSSLYAWDMDDETGKLRGMEQWNDMGPPIKIPLEKAILFRTTKEMNNPEGFSVLRPAHRAWNYKRQIERFEAIGVHRAMQGLPVVRLLQGATIRGQGEGTSTEEKALQIIEHLYDNTMLGVVEDQFMEFRFEAPDMRGISQDSGRIIQRYDESIARAVLAMYILLGTRERGSYALAKELGDLFFLSVEGFINMIAQTFSKWGVPILFRHNVFPGITGFPEITTAINRRTDLEALGNFINSAVGAQIIIPDDELERHIRELADLPAPALQIRDRAIIPAQEGPSEEKVGPGSEKGQEEEAGRLAAAGRAFEAFARKEPSLSQYRSATDAYKEDLRRTYEDWLLELEQSIKSAKTAEDLREKWDDALVIGLLAMKRLGWAALPVAFAIGYRSDAFSPGARVELAAEIASNDHYLETNLWPRIRTRLSLQELEEIRRLYATGRDEDAHDLLWGALFGIRANAGQYSGAFWRVIWAASILRVEEASDPDLGGPGTPWPGIPERVRWIRDALAEHCETCMLFGDREYDSIEELLARTGGVLPGQGTECNGN